MNREAMQEQILTVVEDDASLQLLYDVWSLIRRAPARATDILMQFQDVSSSAKHAAMELQKAFAQYDKLAPRLPELECAVKMVDAFSNRVASIDDAVVMNRIARITSLAKSISQMKRDGTLDMLSTVIGEKEGER